MMVVLVGDLCNKGPFSADVVRYVRSQRNWHVVRGNHDNSVLRAALLHQTDKYTDWLWKEEDASSSSRTGTTTTCVLSDAELVWMSELPYSIHLPDHNVRVVHAGLVPGVPLEEQTVYTMTHMRNVVLGSSSTTCCCDYTPSAATTDGVAWVDAWQGPEHVVFGHDAGRGLQQAKFATGLDTGACYGKQLTGLVLPDWKLVQVPARSEYCPIGGTKAQAPSQGEQTKQ